MTSTEPATRVGRLIHEAQPNPLDTDKQKLTIHLTQRTHQTLRALANWRGVTKTALADELLAAAIYDALDALQDRVFLEPSPNVEVGGKPLTGPYTARDFVKDKAEEFCRGYLDGVDYERFGAPGSTGVRGEGVAP